MTPLLVWGPYLWANGSVPRQDGLVWLPEDLTNDCTHPSDLGRQKVAQMLMDFFKNDFAATPWFLVQATSTNRIFLPLVIKTNFTAMALLDGQQVEAPAQLTIDPNASVFLWENQSNNTKDGFRTFVDWVKSILIRT